MVIQRLSSRGERRNVVAHVVVEADEILLVEEMDHHRRDGLRRRQRTERRIRRADDLRRVGRIPRPVAAHVTDRAVEEHGAVAAHAQADGRVDAAAIEAPYRFPDAIAGLGRHAHLGRRDLGLPPDAGDGVQIRGHARAREPGRERWKTRQHPLTLSSCRSRPTANASDASRAAPRPCHPARRPSWRGSPRPSGIPGSARRCRGRRARSPAW